MIISKNISDQYSILVGTIFFVLQFTIHALADFEHNIIQLNSHHHHTTRLDLELKDIQQTYRGLDLYKLS